MLDISCILINYNTSHFTVACVQSIIENTQKISFEIIIIDNASAVADYKKLASAINTLNQPNITLVRNPINVGFGAGNMLGVQVASSSKYYAFINNDTLFVTPDTLKTLKTFMEQTPDAAVCSPQMLDENRNFRVTIDHFSSLQREILRRPLLEKIFPNTYLNRKKRFKNPTAVHYVQGSFMFCDAQSFNNIGGFDTNLFLYYEESDVCRRLLKKLQKQTYIVPQVEYIHYKGASTGRTITIKKEQKISLIYYTEKHYGWIAKKCLLIYYCSRYFFTSLIKPKYWSLFLLFLKGAPLSKSLKQKQKIQLKL